jgi:hypothetical protein
MRSRRPQNIGWIVLAWLPLAPASMGAVFCVVLGASFLTTPHVRVGELEENRPSKEQVEVASLVIREGRKMRPYNQVHDPRIVITHFTFEQPGRNVRHALSPPPGHRLPNGLLAPITC